MKPRPILDRILSPADVRALPEAELAPLAAEIRAELVDVIARTGGHLASNLGTVELTVALLRVFDPSRDRLVWDTGHQTYTYKLLTGRRALFQQLRQTGGCCGFLSPQESPYDAFGAGHAGTAISAALGMATARDRRGETHRVVAILGDGALSCGVSFEGLNSIIEKTNDFILIVNDNKMAIAPNVGAMARYLNRVITGEGYNRFKGKLREFLTRIPRIGRPLRNVIRRLEEATKSVLVPGVLFEELGLRYLGPIDGHDMRALTETFQAAQRLRQPLVIHVLTAKGHGYPHAEQAPELFHGLGAFDPTTGQIMSSANGGSSSGNFSDALGTILCRKVEEDERVVAITAGMCQGTGLKLLREKHPDRLMDVGMAEEHAVVFAAGLASTGLRPVVAIYATFMQRAMDYVFHDVCLQQLPVVFCLDRAGFVEDGPTHHGIHDLGFWRCVPHLAILQPADTWELEQMLSAALDRGEPTVVRYPKGSAVPQPLPAHAPMVWGKAEVVRPGTQAAVWALGPEVWTALTAAEELAQAGIQVAVVNTRFLNPFDDELLAQQARTMPIVTIENHVVPGGLASAVDERLAGRDGHGVLHCGWPTEVIPFGQEQDLRRRFGLTPSLLAERLQRFLQSRQATAGT